MNNDSSHAGHGSAAVQALPGEAHPRGVASPRRISSAELFSGAREILIDHSGVTYTLRHTSLGKLILTK